MEETKLREPSILIRAVRHSPYEEYIHAEHTNARDRIQDIEQLALFAEKQTELERFLAEASLQESYANPLAQHDRDDDAVILSTVHQAKGLEWEAVFVLNMTSGQFPNDRALKERKGIEEERRLFYVAVTRAKRQLYLTYPLMAGFQTLAAGPSPFIEEIDNGAVSMNVGGSSHVWNDPSDEGDGVVYVSDEDDWTLNKSTFLADIAEL